MSMITVTCCCPWCDEEVTVTRPATGNSVKTVCPQCGMPILVTGIAGVHGPTIQPDPIHVAESGVLVGTRRELNFIPSASVSIAAVDDPANDKVDLTFTSAGGGLPPGTAGDLLEFDKTTLAWLGFPPGAAGTFLKSMGAGNDPVWAAGGGGGDMLAAHYAIGAYPINNSVGLPWLDHLGFNLPALTVNASANLELLISAVLDGSLDLNSQNVLVPVDNTTDVGDALHALTALYARPVQSTDDLTLAAKAGKAIRASRFQIKDVADPTVAQDAMTLNYAGLHYETLTDAAHRLKDDGSVPVINNDWLEWVNHLGANFPVLKLNGSDIIEVGQEIQFDGQLDLNDQNVAVKTTNTSNIGAAT